jgi:histidinol-phosphate aminotransferase
MGLTVVDSDANFLMVVLPDAEQARRLGEDMLKQGIIIRPLGAFGLPHCVRVSTGTDEENEMCVAAMQKAPSAARV